MGDRNLLEILEMEFKGFSFLQLRRVWGSLKREYLKKFVLTINRGNQNKKFIVWENSQILNLEFTYLSRGIYAVL